MIGKRRGHSRRSRKVPSQWCPTGAPVIRPEKRRTVHRQNRKTCRGLVRLPVWKRVLRRLRGQLGGTGRVDFSSFAAGVEDVSSCWASLSSFVVDVAAVASEGSCGVESGDSAVQAVRTRPASKLHTVSVRLGIVRCLKAHGLANGPDELAPVSYTHLTLPTKA